MPRYLFAPRRAYDNVQRERQPGWTLDRKQGNDINAVVNARAIDHSRRSCMRIRRRVCTFLGIYPVLGLEKK